MIVSNNPIIYNNVRDSDMWTEAKQFKHLFNEVLW